MGNVIGIIGLIGVGEVIGDMLLLLLLINLKLIGLKFDRLIFIYY